MIPVYSNFQYNPYNPYNPYSSSPVTGMNSPYQSSRQEIIKVNGREGANNFSLPANSSALLLDSSQPVIYLKQTDGGGYANITAYSITPYEPEQAVIDTNDLEKRIKRLEDIINESDTSNVKRTRTKQSAQSDPAD